MPLSERIWTRLSPVMMKELKALAKRDDRSVSFTIRRAVLAYLKKRNPDWEYR